MNTDLKNFTTALCWLALCAACTSADVVIEVDNINGHDTVSCYSKDNHNEPCRTLDYALIYGLNSSKANVMMNIHEGVYTINHLNLSFYDLNNITIYGAGSNLTVINCSFGTGLGFFNVKKLVLANFTLFGGGSIRYSTSINTTSGDMAVFRVALYLLDCSNVTVDGLVITNSTGTGLVMYDVKGNIDIINSIFQFNAPLETEELPGDGGVSVLFTHNETVTIGTVYNIQNCSFLLNVANSSNSTELFQPSLYATFHQQFGRGGGLTVVLRGVAQNNTVMIKDCKFLHNQAMWGGGLFVGLLDKPNRNFFILESVLFDSNVASSNGFLGITGAGGGAVRISSTPNFFLNYSTTFKFVNCLFLRNVADLGGGVSFELVRENARTSAIYFTNCTWHDNVGHLGSAMYAYVYIYPFGDITNVNIDSCNFIENSNDHSQLSQTPLGLGTVYLWSVPVTFSKKNMFIGNNGSALVGISTWFILENEAVLVFKENTAENGGGITLLDGSYLILFQNTALNFTNNTATGKGGAIYAVTDDRQRFTSTRFCFISFYDFTVSPYKWRENNVTVYFANNRAKYGYSIFTTTLLTCVWGELMKVDLAEIKQVYYWNGTFMYEGINDVSDLQKEISTDAARVENLKNASYHFPPGKLNYFDLVAENDREEAVDTIYFVTTNDSSVAMVDGTYSYTAEANTILYGAPGSVVDLKMVTVNHLPLSISISVKLDDCPPGFYPSIESRFNKTVCKCSVNETGQEYFGIVKCDSLNMIAYLQSSYFAGYKTFGSKIVLLTSNCPERYCYHGTSSSVPLPSDSSSTTLDDTICKSQNRTGMLCGKCSNGNHIFINSHNYHYKCGECNMPLWKEILLLFVAKYIPLTIFVIVIGFFNVSLLNGTLNSFVMFSQLLPFMDIYAGGRISIVNEPVVETYRFLYNMWNLNFFEIVLPGFCVLHTQSALNMLIFDYLITFLYMIILTIIIYTSGLLYDKKIRKGNHHYLWIHINKFTGAIRSFVLGKNETSFHIQGLLTAHHIVLY